MSKEDIFVPSLRKKTHLHWSDTKVISPNPYIPCKAFRPGYSESLFSTYFIKDVGKKNLPASGGPVKQPSPTKNMEKPIELFTFSDPTKST